MDRIKQFFSANFMVPHGSCFLWLPEIVWLHVFADALIAIAYFSIPLALWHFARKRPDVPFNKVFILFALFITLCGLTHVFGIFVLWQPYYGIEGLLMLATGVISAATAILVWRIMPVALTLPSPNRLKNLNEELKSAYEQTEEKVRERTQSLEIANKELVRARESALNASQIKSDFLANVSHEIRTPMNVVVGITDILSASGGSLNDAQRDKLLDTLKLSTRTLLALIDDLLDISKIESQTVELEQVTFSIHDMIEETASLMKVKAKEKGIDFQVVFLNPDLKHLIYTGDPKRKQQIVMNLCSNAIKFTETGFVRITVDIEPGNRPDRQKLILVVEDTGIGIAEDKLDLIFEKFVQADTSINRKYGGTGLGLTISKTLIDIMGGTITATSVKGQGSRFTVTIPVRLADTQSPLIARHENEPLPTARQRSADSKTALLVEDYEPNVLVATIFMERLGFSCDVVRSGQEAIESYQKAPYSLILMDIQMPGMDGIEATRRIRAYERDKNLPKSLIIAITADAFAEKRTACLEAGMQDVLIKPYKIQELEEKIRALLH